MSIKGTEYRAETFKIVGLAISAPLGNLFLFPIRLFNELGFTSFAIYAFISVIGFILGVTIINRGFELLE